MADTRKLSGEDLMVEYVRRWKFDPALFADQALGAKLSAQQKDGCKAVGELCRAKYRKSRGEGLSPQQEALCKKLGVSVASGHNTGKDFWLAIVCVWWQVCWPYSKGLVTGPNASTLKSVLWHEFRKRLRTGTFLGTQEGWLNRFFEIQADKLILKEANGESYIEARTANVKGSADEQGEALAGRHEKYLLLAVDEASGVSDGVYKPIEGAMAGAVNFAILIGNMTRRSGYFYNTHHDIGAKKFWTTMRWNTEESDLDTVSGGQTACQGLVDMYASKYGRDSNPFRVRIQGLPPSAEDDVLIPWEWIERAIDRPLTPAPDDPFMYGVDVAWLGKDRSTICKRRGPVVEEIADFRGIDPMQLVGWVVRNYSEDKEKGEAPQSVFVDTIGMGAGVFTRLREQGYPAVSVVVSETANDKEQFGNKRNELWHTLRKQFQDGTISIPNDEDLIDELSTMKVHPPDSSGVMRVFSKSEWRKAGMGKGENHSPDKADSLCLTYAGGSNYKAADGGAGWQEDRWLEKNAYRPLNSMVGY